MQVRVAGKASFTQGCKAIICVNFEPSSPTEIDVMLYSQLSGQFEDYEFRFFCNENFEEDARRRRAVEASTCTSAFHTSQSFTVLLEPCGGSGGGDGNGKNAGSGLFGLTMEQTLVVAVSLVTIIAVPAFVIAALNYGPLQKRVAARDTARVEVVRELHKVYVSLT